MEITTQSLAEKINASTILQMQLRVKIAEKRKELEASPLYAEIEMLKKQLQEEEKQDSEIRENMKQKMLSAGMKKFEALDGSVAQLNKTPASLVIEDESEIPEEYKKEKTTISVDKKQLKEDIKEGLILDGVCLKEDYNLVIK